MSVEEITSTSAIYVRSAGSLRAFTHVDRTFIGFSMGKTLDVDSKTHRVICVRPTHALRVVSAAATCSRVSSGEAVVLRDNGRV